ncbi:LutC/YkgG family protein [Afifella aestuarii]|uniref:LutC/YkgG family protein n=1 Tax=Afifella aestuarii TaxID=1909496 RepID=UPI000FE377A0|nr:lactate utilization protein [Afifella aestuarii]
MSQRETVLGKIRRGLASGKSAEARREIVAQRLGQHPANTVPARGHVDQQARLDLFAKMAEKVSATVERVASASDLPETVAEYLRARNLPSDLRMGADRRLADLPWDKVPQLEVKHGPSDGRDHVGLSHAFGGAAETGTLFLLSGPDNPTTLNFLPDHHLVVVRASDIVGDYETLWNRLREHSGDGVLPRTVNLITGPSRSADIEQTLLLGAHGPRALHILIVEDA